MIDKLFQQHEAARKAAEAATKRHERRTHRAPCAEPAEVAV